MFVPLINVLVHACLCMREIFTYADNRQAMPMALNGSCVCQKIREWGSLSPEGYGYHPWEKTLCCILFSGESSVVTRERGWACEV